ncbi:MAG: arginine--tRNA ligase [Baekduia sp.]
MDHPLDRLRDSVREAASVISDADPSSAPTLERPKNPDHGDYATNAAMLLAGGLRRPPRDVAGDLAGALQQSLGDALTAVDVAGPGFLNLTLSDDWYLESLDQIVAAGERYGAEVALAPENVNVEFVSANPTGPVHMGHARNAAFGDSLARTLSFAGHTVTREYYVNDFGTQALKFAESVQARARGEEVPEDGYPGDYVAAIALQVPDAASRPVAEIAPEAIELMRERIAASLHAFGVEFDVWFSERSLHETRPGKELSGVEHGFEVLEQHGHTYRTDGALWLRTTDFGDDKDRVLERSTGEHTYFASDIAYAQHKRERSFGRMIYVLGADHHGYIGRMKAAYQALGGQPETLELLIMQFVHLVRGGEKVSMSKRAGEFVTLDELIEEIGVDASRWYLLNRSHDTTIEVDLALASSESAENPVYYVQYAHARIARMLDKAGEARVAEALESSDGDVGLPALEPAERRLIGLLLEFPAEIAEAAERRAPHRIASYALTLAQAFSAFYRDCLVVGAEPPALESARIRLSVATQRTLATALWLLGVSAPTSM